MKTKTLEFTRFNYLGNFFRRISIAIVSGLPREKILLKPENVTIMQPRKESYKPDSEKHYHHPLAKPVVEKQTLLKNKKKIKAPR